MSEISTLISLIETAIKEKTIDKMYNAFLEEALRLGISSYSLNRLIGCIKNKIETPQEGSLAANQIPFIQQITPIKLEPEIRYVDRVVEMSDELDEHFGMEVDIEFDNIGFIRDCKTKKFVAPAPIFGNSYFKSII